MRAARLIAALAVVVGHGAVLHGMPAPRLGGVPIETLGLYVFFAISGWVITGSWLSDPRPTAFLRKRALRIVPGLVAVVAVTVLVIGPLATSLPLQSYLRDPATWRYLSALAFTPTYTLPGVFADHRVSTVNGSLWTLGLEVVCYLSIAAVAALFGRYASIAVAVIAIFLMSGCAMLPRTDVGSTLAVCAFFALGALLRLSPGARVRLPLAPVLVVGVMWLVLGSFREEVASVLLWIVVPAVVAAIATRVRRSPADATDLSYGTYLWGYPIQQLVIEVNPHLPLPASIGITVLLTLGTAALSWHYVEQPALRWRPVPDGHALAAARAS